MNENSAVIGSLGEDAAMEWLRERGYYIVERNWRIGRYEVDIIAEHYDTLHFVEVKTRKEGSWQSAYDSIDEQKIRTLRRAAAYYRAKRRVQRLLQFDLIAVTHRVDGSLAIEYIENII